MKLSQTSRILVLRGFWQLIVLQAVTVPFFHDRGLTTSEIFVVQMLFTLVLTVLDIPASVLSGHIGRRNSLIFAALAKAIGGMLLVPNLHFAGILAAYAMIALGNSFYSGIESSLLYDGIQSDPDPKALLKRTLATSYTVTLSSTIVANVLGGLMAKHFGFQAVAYINAILAFSSLIVALTIEDVYQPNQDSLARGESGETLRAAASILMSRQRLAMVCLLIVMGVAGPVFGTLLQIHLYDRQVDLIWFGILIGVQNALGAFFGILLRSSLVARLGRLRADMLVLLPAIAAFGLLNAATLLMLPVVLATMEAAKSISFVVVGGEFASSYESRARATVSSMQSVLVRIGSIGVNAVLAVGSHSRASGQLSYGLALTLAAVAIGYRTRSKGIGETPYPKTSGGAK